MNRRRSRTLAAIWFLALALLAAAAPGMGSRAAAAQGVGQASYGGVSFSYDMSLANSVRGQTVSNNVGQGGLPSEVRPQHILFSFDGYPSKGVWTPQIRVIPYAEYKATQSQSAISNELSSLETYLASGTGKTLPNLPPVNAERIISEDVAPVAGSGVSGVRYIASYSQGVVPVTADNVTYMFIGLTLDNKYYVEGTFPLALTTPLDPIPSPLTEASVQAYNKAVANRLSKTGNEGFSPNLDLLDKMMVSLKVEASVTPGMPTTGAPQDGGLLIAIGAFSALITVLGMVIIRRSGASRPR